MGRESDAESEKDGVCGLTVAPHYILDGFSLNIKTEDLACAARALGSAKPGAKKTAGRGRARSGFSQLSLPLCLFSACVTVSRVVAQERRPLASKHQRGIYKTKLGILTGILKCTCTQYI